MTNEYELADDNRADLIYEKQDLLAPLLPGMEQPPHPMRLGDDEGDYYRGDVTRRRRRRPSTSRPAGRDGEAMSLRQCSRRPPTSRRPARP